MLGDIEAAQGMIRGASAGVHPIDAKYKQLKVDLVHVKPHDKTYKLLAAYAKDTMHQPLELLHMWSVDRHNESKRFKAYDKLKERKLLW